MSIYFSYVYFPYIFQEGFHEPLLSREMRAVADCRQGIAPIRFALFSHLSESQKAASGSTDGAHPGHLFVLRRNICNS